MSSSQNDASRAHCELQSLWTLTGLNPALQAAVELPDQSDLFASSFETGLAVQTAIGAAAASAASLYEARSGQAQSIQVNRHDAERECSAYFELNGKAPPTWTPISGLYETATGCVRVHANFDHHRDGVLKLLGLAPGPDTPRTEAEAALKDWEGEAFETAAAKAGLVVSYIRTFEDWDRHPHALAMRDEPPVKFRKIGEAPPRQLPGIRQNDRPLNGMRVLEMTRILAGPIAGRTLAAYGADVLLINGPHLPNIPFITDTSRGKRSAFLDLRTPKERAVLDRLLDETNVYIQGYRPGALSGFGLSEDELATRHPGLVQINLSAYGAEGPWGGKRGFDSLVQAATGFNHAEGLAAGLDRPGAFPIQALDYCAGFFMAFAASAALMLQTIEGGTWGVDVSLLAVANWLRGLGRREADFSLPRADVTAYMAEYLCDHGKAFGLPHAAQFSTTPPRWDRPSVLPGTHAPSWT